MADIPDVRSRLGVYMFTWGAQPPMLPDLIDLAQHIERLGLDSIHMPWHFTVSPQSFKFGNTYNLDPLVVLPMIAAKTERVRIGIDPWFPSAMHPYFWAQYLSSLDIVTGGRVLSGVRTAWWIDDIRVGQSSEELNEKGYDDAMVIVDKLWRGEELDGDETDIWDVKGLLLDPYPSRPIPLWINGYDDREIQRAARWGSALRPLFLDPNEAPDLRAKLDAACQATGRKVDLATSTIALITEPTDDPAWIHENIHEALERRLRGRDVTVTVGGVEHVAERLALLYSAGVEYILIDTQLHGYQDIGFSKEQCARLAEGVAPLVERSLGGIQ